VPNNTTPSARLILNPRASGAHETLATTFCAKLYASYGWRPTNMILLLEYLLGGRPLPSPRPIPLHYNSFCKCKKRRRKHIIWRKGQETILKVVLAMQREKIYSKNHSLFEQTVIIFGI